MHLQQHTNNKNKTKRNSKTIKMHASVEVTHFDNVQS